MSHLLPACLLLNYPLQPPLHHGPSPASWVPPPSRVPVDGSQATGPPRGFANMPLSPMAQVSVGVKEDDRACSWVRHLLSADMGRLIAFILYLKALGLCLIFFLYYPPPG